MNTDSELLVRVNKHGAHELFLEGNATGCIRFGTLAMHIDARTQTYDSIGIIVDGQTVIVLWIVVHDMFAVTLVVNHSRVYHLVVIA